MTLYHGTELNSERYITTYVVRFCGCTDCFPHAAFISKEKAEAYAELMNRNPEGYIIMECTTLEEFIKEWLDND